MAIIYIDRELSAALWDGRQVSIEMAECLLNQYEVLGYHDDHNGKGLHILIKK